MYRENKGITLVVLVVTIIVMLIIAAVGINIGSDLINKSKLEDVKTNMLAIQGKAKTIAEKNAVDNTQELIGVKIEKSNGYEIEGYPLSQDLKNTLTKEIYYVWTQEQLDNKGLNSIKVNGAKFYIVDYEESEIFYSLGYEGKYKLSELKNM